MAKKKVGDLIREARTNAGLTQEQLAKKVDGVAASDISKAERGEKDLTQAALKQIAKATGVTQKSLLDAASGTSGGGSKAASSSTKKPTASTTKKATSSTKKSTDSSAKKSASSTKKTTASAKKADDGEKYTAAEKKLVELYRAANADVKKAAVALLKGEKAEGGSVVESLLGGALDLLSNLGK